MTELRFEQDPRFTLIKSEESFKDWKYKDIMRVTADDYMSKTYDYTNDIPYIDNQYDTGFCWAFSTALMQAAYEKRETGETIDLSPYYVAKVGKALDGITSTEGSTMKNAIEVITNIGTVKRQFYDGIGYKVGSLSFPDINFEDKLRHYKSKNYARCNSLQDIVLALSQGKLPLIGIQCTKQIYDLNDGASKYLEFDPNGTLIIIGGHQMVVCGWFPDMEHNGHKGYIKCANSWGKDYGENGFMYIPRDYIEFRTKDGFFRMLSDSFATVDLTNDNIKEVCVEMQIDNTEAFVNDEKVILDTAPIICKDRTFVPIRFISESLGADVNWIEDKREVIVTNDDITIHLYIDKDYAFINGKRVQIYAAPYINNSSCLVPIRFIAEALDFVVLWGGSETKKITILK